MSSSLSHSCSPSITYVIFSVTLMLSIITYVIFSVTLMLSIIYVIFSIPLMLSIITYVIFSVTLMLSIIIYVIFSVILILSFITYVILFFNFPVLLQMFASISQRAETSYSRNSHEGMTCAEFHPKTQTYPDALIPHPLIFKWSFKTSQISISCFHLPGILKPWTFSTEFTIYMNWP